MTATITLQGTATTERSSRNWPKIAGLTYVGAWVVGLTAFGVGPAATRRTPRSPATSPTIAS